MPLILPGNVASATAAVGYDVANSCIFDDGSSAKLTKTLGTPTTANKFTLSFWIKRSSLQLGSNTQTIINTDSGNLEEFIRFEENDRLHIYFQTAAGAQAASVKPTYMFRDIASWYHIVIGIDTTQGTDTNRFKFWVNGTRLTTFTTASYVAENYTLRLNTAVAHEMFTRKDSDYLDGYIAELVYIDGQQLDADQFGEFNSDSPTIWQPVDPSDLTFGDNGHYLDFEASDNLGNDANGGTDWTESGLAATDQSTDTPTNNFNTLNPLLIRQGQDLPTYSEGNLKADHDDSNNNQTSRGTILLHHGKWYFEVLIEVVNYTYIGTWQTEGAWTNPGIYDGLSGVNTYRGDGKTNDENVGLADYGDTFAADDIIGCAFDCDTGTIWFSKNGTWQNSATQGEVVAGTTANAAFTGKAYSTNGVVTNITGLVGSACWVNFGSPPSGFTISSGNADDNGYGNFEYDVPTGYYAICTKNLAEFGG